MRQRGGPQARCAKESVGGYRGGGAEDRQQIIADFDEVVYMTPKELEEWLETDASRSVGRKDDGRESTGHRSGRRIAEIQRKKKSDYTDGDLAHMRKVNGYVKRHLKQKPKDDVENPRWRYSLMYFSNATHVEECP